MDPKTRQQLLRLGAEFYEAHAEGFDASRGHQPWPGWQHWADRWLPGPQPSGADLRVLDVGCGNARLARFLADRGFSLDYIGIDGNAELLTAAKARLPAPLAQTCALVHADFLVPPVPGAQLPAGPFDVVALFGVLHHVPGHDWRRALLANAARRVAPGGLLILAAWQFAGRPRFEKKTVPWADWARASGVSLDPAMLSPGDYLLRFGADPQMPPRYCHQVSSEEFGAYPGDLEREGFAYTALDDYRADGGEGDLNRYLVLRRDHTD